MTGRERKEVRALVQRVLEEARFTMKEAGELMGIGYQTVRRWKAGQRVPDAQTRLRLAEAFERHAGKLQRLAAELRKTTSG